MPLWYVVRDPASAGPQLWAWTYAASQKVRNLERDPRATLQVEAGEDYEELRGVMLESRSSIAARHRARRALGSRSSRATALPRASRLHGAADEVARDDRRAGAQARRAPIRRALARRAGTTASSAASTERPGVAMER